MKRYINDILTKILTLTLLLFAGANVAWGQTEPVEITTTDDITNGTKKLYLIQTNQFESFYLIPKGNDGLNTLNLPNEQMLWYFLDAGMVVESGNNVQYYYIVSNSTGKYISNTQYYDTNPGRTVKMESFDSTKPEKFMFKLVEDNTNGTTGFYNIDIKPNGSSWIGLNKQGGSVSSANGLRLTNDDSNHYIHDYSSKWKFLRFTDSFTWPAPPFTPSTDDNKHFCKLQSAVTENSTFFVSADDTDTKNVTIASTNSHNMVWYFKEVPADPTDQSTTWFKYYYIVNPEAEDQYMYYKGTVTNGTQQNNAVILKEKTSENEDRYQFIIVRAARVKKENGKDVPDECYTIIPKLLRDKYWDGNSFNSVGPNSVGDGNTMGIIKGRDGADNNSHWTIVKNVDYEYQCDQPVITFSNTTGVTITSATDGATIRYTLDESEPDGNSSLYEGSFTIDAAKTIKAIATKDGMRNSEVATISVSKVETPEIINDGTNIVISCNTNGATIHYSSTGEPDGNSPIYTPGVTQLNVSDYTVGQTIKAIAIKEGCVNSDVYSLAITGTCVLPVISLNDQTGAITITSATDGAMIRYTLDGTEPDGSSSLYDGPFTINAAKTIKAIAIKSGLENSVVATESYSQVATPSIQNNGSNAISMACTTEGAEIHYAVGGTVPTYSSNTYSTPLTENVSGQAIKAIAFKAGMVPSTIAENTIRLQCSKPIITKGEKITISCDYPTSGVTIYYSDNGSEPSTVYPEGGITIEQYGITIKAIARATNYEDSEEASKLIMQNLDGSGTAADPFIIRAGEFGKFVTTVAEEPNAYYKLVTNVEATNDIITTPFTGIFEADADANGNFYKITGLKHALFNTINGGTVKNVILDEVNITTGSNVGAIANVASGDSRIYNCGVLATAQYDAKGNFTGFGGSSISGSNNVGGIVGFLDGSSRVINCYNYANIIGGSNRGGIVGWNNVATTSTNVKTMVMNCMFYGNSTGGTMRPIFGGELISNAGETAVNLYNYYRNGEDVTFDDDYTSFDDYYCALPADEDYLTRFEYYRSILNSNRQLCVWWITGHVATAQTADDGKLMAKWVLDPTIAPYPILKKWGKYPSVINRDKENVWNPISKENISRTSANPYQGKKLNTITVNVNAGAKHAGTGSTSKTLTNVIVLDMDTLNHDYGYYKIQLPYYNEVFGNPEASGWDERYGGNYKDYVVTGWKITNISGGTTGSFKGYAVASVPQDAVSAGKVTPDVTTGNPWEDGFNLADRNCTNKDLYSKSGRVFAQGGYYYVPEGVNTITIEAYWGKAVYLHNKDHSMDRVSVANVSADGKDGDGDTTGADFGYSFSPAGTLAESFQENTVYTSLQDAISNLTLVGTSYTVYDQAIVLVGNVQVKNRGASLGRASDKPAYNRPFTIMSCDLDMDNEPDYCLQLQQRNTVNRPGIHPIRFDFLPVPELGLAIRANDFAYAIGLMVPQGHFEITETALMHTTQFEYDAAVGKVEAPLILNGGDFEQMVLRYGPKDRTSYILMGGNFSLTRFTPGWHANNTQNGGNIRHCAVNAIGGNFSEFYLSGIYHPDFSVNQDNPHCYVNGGKFGIMAGAGYEQVNGSVTFQIDHSLIREFYGGGINGSKPVTGDITVTINNSLVDKYCGGPKVGSMAYIDNEVTKYKTVTTNATGTTFGVYYGGGNGGTSYYRQNIKDYTGTFPTSNSGWEGFSKFNPLNQVSGVTAAYDNGDDKKGYHAEYEFEVFNSSNGLKSGEDVIRTYYNWAQFGTTTTGNVTSTLTDCTVKGNFYGGGNLANVIGTVTSTLKGKTHVYGSAFGAGFSASVPSFRVHDKSTVKIPTKDSAGNVDEEGSLDYYKDGVEDRYYKWSNEKPSGVSTSKPTFQDDDGNWYCYTEVSLKNLGTVTGNVTLSIEGTSVVEGKIDIGKTTEKQAGGVFGGGDASEVVGNTTVSIKATGQQSGYTYNTYNVFGGGNEADVQGNASAIMNNGIVSQSVYGGGNEANVTGNTTVTLAGNAEVLGDVFGGGNNGEVGGTATVNIQPTIE